jgi:hypothetical protein
MKAGKNKQTKGDRKKKGKQKNKNKPLTSGSALEFQKHSVDSTYHGHLLAAEGDAASSCLHNMRSVEWRSLEDRDTEQDTEFHGAVAPCI